MDSGHFAGWNLLKEILVLSVGFVKLCACVEALVQDTQSTL